MSLSKLIYVPLLVRSQTNCKGHTIQMFLVRINCNPPQTNKKKNCHIPRSGVLCRVIGICRASPFALLAPPWNGAVNMVLNFSVVWCCWCCCGCCCCWFQGGMVGGWFAWRSIWQCLLSVISLNGFGSKLTSFVNTLRVATGDSKRTGRYSLRSAVGDGDGFQKVGGGGGTGGDDGDWTVVELMSGCWVGFVVVTDECVGGFLRCKVGVVDGDQMPVGNDRNWRKGLFIT